jgi:hypothetical protein
MHTDPGGIGPPGRGLPPVRTSNANGRGEGELGTNQQVIACPPERKRKARAKDEMRWARVCLSYEELREFLGR